VTDHNALVFVSLI